MSNAPAEHRTEDVETLRRAALRVTAPRLTVLDVVRDGDHLAVDEIVVRSRGRLGSISKQAVYDVLAALCGAGLVRRIEPAGSPARFETRVDDNHHHLICRSCGGLTDVACAVGEAPCMEPSECPVDFVVDTADVIYWGVCSDCQAGFPRINGVADD